VLMQSGKGAELGAAFGGVGQAQSTRSPMTGIGKATTVLAVLFMTSSLTLAYMSSERASDSVLKELQTLPEVPGGVLPPPQAEIPLPAGDAALPAAPLPEEEAPAEPDVELEQTEAPALPPVELEPSPAAPEATEAAEPRSSVPEATAPTAPAPEASLPTEAPVAPSSSQ
jgi:preprotein translocase subunit SecG